MRKKYLILALILFASCWLVQFVYPDSPNDFDEKDFPYTQVIPDPPKADSATAKAEFDTLLHWQHKRTPAEVARARREVKIDVHTYFDDVLGDWFQKDELPRTRHLLAQVLHANHTITTAAKKHWDRQRPYQQNPAIHPCVEKPGNQSYPSGHANAAEAYALVLAALCPDLREPIMARAKQIGDDRVLAGVHFPSDVSAGRSLAEAVFRSLSMNPQFQSELNAAKAEVAKAREGGQNGE